MFDKSIESACYDATDVNRVVFGVEFVQFLFNRSLHVRVADAVDERRQCRIQLFVAGACSRLLLAVLTEQSHSKHAP